MCRRSPSIVALVAAHVVAAIALAVLADDGEATVLLSLYVGVTFCQTSLLGIWGGLGTNHWAFRLLGVALGIVVLAPLFNWGLNGPYHEPWYDFDIEILGLVSLCTLATAGFMLLVRRMLELRVVQAGSVAVNAIALGPEGLQFSIRHLIILTFVVASFVGLGKWLHPYVGNLNNSVHLGVLGLCFVAVGLGTPWATLSSGSPIPRGFVVLAIALSAAFVPLSINSYWHVGFWIVVMLCEAGLLLLSLCVVRWCGYRLVRRGTFSPLNRPTVVGSSQPSTVSQL